MSSGTILEDLLIKHEELRLHPYTDTTRHLTIGVGRNLTDRGIDEEEAWFLLGNDIELAVGDLSIIFADFADFSDNRRNALIDMIFNLGRNGFMQFKTMIQAIRDGDWSTAANSMRTSLWHTQLPDRVNEDADMIEGG
jgi:lysozyme